MTLARKGLKKGDRKEEVGKDRRKNTRQKRERRKKSKKKASTFFAGKEVERTARDQRSQRGSEVVSKGANPKRFSPIFSLLLPFLHQNRRKR